MFNMKLNTLLLTIAFLVTETKGLSLSQGSTYQRSALRLSATAGSGDDTPCSHSPAHLFGTVALASSLLLSSVAMPSYAADVSTETMPIPSMVLSEQIRTLDMSMPTYGDVSDAKASVENVKGLAEEYKQPALSSSSSGGGGRYISSSEKAQEKAAKKREAAEAKARARAEFERENLGGKAVETVDLSAPSYDASTVQSPKSAFSL